MLDAVIVGGGAAGLTAALYLGRFRRNVILFDTGKQANRVSHAAHGFFTRDGSSPSELIRIGHEQLRPYETVSVQSCAVTAISPENGHFRISLEDGSELRSHKVLLAVGLKDSLPSVPNIEQFWGKSVFHCPYCDGWEMRDQPVAIIADGAAGFHLAKLLRVLTSDLVLCTNGNTELAEEERASLLRHDVKIIEAPIARLEGQGETLEAIVFSEGQRLSRKGIFVRPKSVQQANFAAQLGCQMAGENLIQVDEMGRTSISGVYAAGDIASRMRQVLMASMQGASAAIGINTDLIAEDFI
jgi:thioredoxin reductase